MKFKCPKCFKKKWFYFFLFIAIIIVIVFINQSKNKAQDSYKSYQITSMDLSQTVSAPGKITAGQQATLRFQTGGQLVWVGVKKGDRVSKWQAIASLDQRQLEKSLSKYLNTYLSTRFDFDNTIKTNENNIGDRSHINVNTIDDQDQALKLLIQKAQLGMDQTVLDVEIAEISRQYAHLYSPIDGIVIKATDENPGVNVSALSTEYVIVNPDTLRFSAEVEELDIAKVKEGLQAIVNLDAFPDKKINSMVSEIEFSATQNISGNTVFVVNLPLEISSDYRLDMNGDVEIITNQKTQVIAVPIEAVEEIDDQKYVQKLENGEKVQTEIQTGIETDDYYEIISGLNSGDQIAIPE